MDERQGQRSPARTPTPPRDATGPPPAPPRPTSTPFELWRQATDEIDAACRAGGDPNADPTPRYLELLREHGHVVPADHLAAGGRDLPCGWPGQRPPASSRANRIDAVLEASAVVDDRSSEVVVLPRTALFEFLGEVALPAEGDCAEAAQRLVEWVETHRL